MSMAGEPFASDPYVVGKSEPTAEPRPVPAEESLYPVVSHDWVNEEYKHLVVEASPKALIVARGQFFNLLCPSPDGLEQWCAKRGFARVADLTGAMIDEPPMETFAAAAAPIG